MVTIFQNYSHKSKKKKKEERKTIARFAKCKYNFYQGRLPLKEKDHDSKFLGR
jgi:hypothetical protein